MADIEEDPSSRKKQRLLQAAKCGALASATIGYAITRSPDPIPMRNSILTGEMWVQELLNGHHLRIQEQLGVSSEDFEALATDMQQQGLIHISRLGVTPQEQIAIFLHLARTGTSIRMLGERFQRSNDTIQRYVHKVLEALVATPFYNQHVHLPADKCPPQIQNNPKLFPYFHHCRGALDCSHIDSWVPEVDAARYRDRKGRLSQNVFAACDFGLCYVYMCSGWEGTAADSTIFEYVRARDFAVPKGRYYLADAGFPLCDVLMTPYRGVRYHLKEWSRGSQRPRNHKELFNLRHAQARNVVERIFGVTKRRFSLMVASPEYSIEIQNKFVPAMCVLHNYIQQRNPTIDTSNEWDTVEDGLVEADARRLINEPPRNEISPEELGFHISRAEKERAEARRDRIAQRMWADYQAILAEREGE